MCKDNKCPFKIVAATSAKGSNGYTVKEHQCVLPHTCVASRPKITTTSTLDIEIKQAILSCGNVAKATIECREGGTVYEAFSRGGYDLHTGSAKAQRRSMVRVVKRVFRVDEMGLAEALGEISDWVAKFNARPGNGLATLNVKHTDISNTVSHSKPSKKTNQICEIFRI